MPFVIVMPQCPQTAHWTDPDMLELAMASLDQESDGDAQSLKDADIIPTESGVKHEVYLFNFSPQHRWFYFPLMRTDEALLLKCFDTVRDGRARFTAHTAIDDPSTPPGAPARESIEVRALAFFDA